jgi:hypothetical protein
LPRRPPKTDNTRVSPPIKALYIPPKGQQRARREVERAPPTYRLVLLREDTGKVVHAWSGIPHDKVGLLLAAMQRYLPWFARAAAARDAFSKLMDLFG